jgi:6-phosphofructokinase 1
MQSTTDSLDFVTIEGLLAYGEQFARQPAIDGVSAPTAPVPSNDRAARSRQHLAYETVHRLVERPEDVVGCMLAYRERGAIESIPLHAVSPKQFDWDLFARMHGTELHNGPQ